MHPGGFLLLLSLSQGPAGHRQVTAATATVHAAFGACTGPRGRPGRRDSHIRVTLRQCRDAANLAIFPGGHCEEGQLTHNLCFTDTQVAKAEEHVTVARG